VREPVAIARRGAVREWGTRRDCLRCEQVVRVASDPPCPLPPAVSPTDPANYSRNLAAHAGETEGQVVPRAARPIRQSQGRLILQQALESLEPGSSRGTLMYHMLSEVVVLHNAVRPTPSR
jgi:hypothetical protein